MAAVSAGELSCACQLVLYHSPPKVLITVSSAAMLSPQPARPRRQMPETLPGWFSFAAAACDLRPGRVHAAW